MSGLLLVTLPLLPAIGQAYVVDEEVQASPAEQELAQPEAPVAPQDMQSRPVADAVGKS